MKGNRSQLYILPGRQKKAKDEVNQCKKRIQKVRCDKLGRKLDNNMRSIPKVNGTEKIEITMQALIDMIL